MFFLIYREAKRINHYPDKILDMEIWILLAGVIGARALHVFANFSHYINDPISMLYIWKGGLAFYGGLILAILVSIIFMIKNKMPVLKTADLIAPYLALGHSIGRIGCFFNGCCFGKPVTHKFLGVTYSFESIRRHPAQLYAAFCLLLIFVILRIIQKKPKFSGFVFSTYLLLYSTQRFFIDFSRGDNPIFSLGLTISQSISLVIFGVAILMLGYLKKNGTD